MEALEFWSNVLSAWAWPIAVITLGTILLFTQRRAIAEFIDRIKRADFPGGSLDASREAASQTLDAQRTLASIGAGPGESDGVPAPGGAGEQGPDSAVTVDDPVADGDAEPAPTQRADESADTISMTKDELTALVTEFAEAGWAIRGLGQFTEFPRPRLRWRAGRPTVFVWQGQNRKDKQLAEDLNYSAAVAAVAREEVLISELDRAMEELENWIINPTRTDTERASAQEDISEFRRRRAAHQGRREKFIEAALAAAGNSNPR